MSDEGRDAATERDRKEWPPLPRSFYERPVVELARALLGCMLISDGPGTVTGGIIVETEAYAGQEDRASHARAGLTRRTAPMFGAAGQAYVYLVYGMHHCLNVVADASGRAGAVLLRAVEPRIGLDVMRTRRRGTHAAGDERHLAAGPARLCQALAVTRELDGRDLTEGKRLWLACGDDGQAGERPRIVAGPRIGVAYAGDWAERPWRFAVAGSASLSRPFPVERDA